MNRVAAVLVRVVVLLTAEEVVLLAVDRGSDPVVGANIGAGIASLFTGILIPGVWGLVDGWRGPLDVVLNRWVAVAALAGLLAPLRSQGWVPPFDVAVLVFDLVTSSATTFVMDVVPAALGVALGHVAARARRARRAVPHLRRD